MIPYKRISTQKLKGHFMIRRENQRLIRIEQLNKTSLSRQKTYSNFRKEFFNMTQYNNDSSDNNDDSKDDFFENRLQTILKSKEEEKRKRIQLIMDKIKEDIELEKAIIESEKEQRIKLEKEKKIKEDIDLENAIRESEKEQRIKLEKEKKIKEDIDLENAIRESEREQRIKLEKEKKIKEDIDLENAIRESEREQRIKLEMEKIKEDIELKKAIIESEKEERKKLERKKKEEDIIRKLEKEERIKLEEERQLKLAIELSKKDYKMYNQNKNKIIEEKFDENYGICPITQLYMKNPVLTPSGNYYEKSAIIDWIKKNNTDPISREYLTVDMLVEDYEYKKKIIEYRRKLNK